MHWTDEDPESFESWLLETFMACLVNTKRAVSGIAGSLTVVVVVDVAVIVDMIDKDKRERQKY